MDNQNKNPNLSQEDSQWLDELLGKTGQTQEIGPDEQAIAGAGLTRPEDLELEKIMQETLAEDWGNPEQITDQEAVELESMDLSELDEMLKPVPEQEEILLQTAEESAPEEPARQEPAEQAQPEAEPVNLEQTVFFQPVHTQEEPAMEEKKPLRERKPQRTRRPSSRPEKKEAAPEKKAVHEQLEEAVNKIRPKSNKGTGLFGIPHMMATVIWLCIAVAIGISMGRLIWVCAADVLAFGRERQEVVVEILETDDLDTISQKLADAGLVKYPGLFKLFAELTGKDSYITTGKFVLNTIYDYNALVNAMNNNTYSREEVDVMIPEGYTCAQIFALMEEKGICTVAALEEYAANGELYNYWFLENVSRGNRYCLEGFLFPDTYRFYVDDTPRRVLEKLLDGFDYRFSDHLKDKLSKMNTGNKANLDIRQVIILASMIEKESAGGSENYSISSVFHNRLRRPASYPFLNSDATLAYDMETYSKEQYWDETAINNSPFNTYTQKGLPKGAICNPGLDSIDAALSPDTTTYYYFIYDAKSGKSLFSSTYAEHLEKAEGLGMA